MEESLPVNQEVLEVPKAPIEQVHPIHRPIKLPQHMVNLIIILIIAILLLVNFLLKSVNINLDQLRFFVPIATDVNLLTQLLPLRVGIGFVFFWYAIDNFEHPEIFNNLSNTVLKKMGLEHMKHNYYPIAYLQSAVEFLVGISLVTGIFMDVGSALGSLLLLAVLFAYEEGLGSLLIRDIGLLGTTVTLFLITLLGKA